MCKDLGDNVDENKQKTSSLARDQSTNFNKHIFLKLKMYVYKKTYEVLNIFLRTRLH